jgi:hypothetical protein
VTFQVFGFVGREDAQIEHVEKRADGEERARSPGRFRDLL